MDGEDRFGIGGIRDEHPRPDHLAEGETSLAEGALDDREDRPGLRPGVTGVPGGAVRTGVGGPAHPAGVTDRERPAVADPRLPRTARGDPPAPGGRLRLLAHVPVSGRRPA